MYVNYTIHMHVNYIMGGGGGGGGEECISYVCVSYTIHMHVNYTMGVGEECISYVCVNYTIHMHVNYTMYVQELRGMSLARVVILYLTIYMYVYTRAESSTRGYIISHLELMQLCLMQVVTGANTEGGRAR